MSLIEFCIIAEQAQALDSLRLLSDAKAGAWGPDLADFWVGFHLHPVFRPTPCTT